MTTYKPIKLVSFLMIWTMAIALGVACAFIFIFLFFLLHSSKEKQIHKQHALGYFVLQLSVKARSK